MAGDGLKLCQGIYFGHGLRCGFLKLKVLLCLRWLPFYQGLCVREIHSHQENPSR